MGSALTETDSFDATVTGPDAGDPRTAASVRTMGGGLMNRSRYFYNRLRTLLGIGQTFTADATTDVITMTGHGLANGTRVYLTNSGGGLPAGLAVLTMYFVVGATTDTLQLSATSGGAAIDITTAGTGTHTMTVDAGAILSAGGTNSYPGAASFEAHVTVSGSAAALLTKTSFGGVTGATSTVDYTTHDHFFQESSVNHVLTMKSTSPVPPFNAEAFVRFQSIAGTQKCDIKREDTTLLCTFPAGSDSWARLKYLTSFGGWNVIAWGGGTTAVL